MKNEWKKLLYLYPLYCSSSLCLSKYKSLSDNLSDKLLYITNLNFLFQISVEPAEELSLK